MWEAYGKFPGAMTAGLFTYGAFKASGHPFSEVIPRLSLFQSIYAMKRYAIGAGGVFFLSGFVGLRLGAQVFGHPEELQMLRRNKHEI